jgi:queuine tRNA-ribosyltransferase
MSARRCITLVLIKSFALKRTHDWAIRCLDEHQRLTIERSDKPYQALFGVIQGAQYEDLRKEAAADLGSMNSSGHLIRWFRYRWRAR